jgi:signal transduction histidine kinase
MVFTDPTRIRQILFNLLSNAVKFTRSGRIRIRAGNMQGIAKKDEEEEQWHYITSAAASETAPGSGKNIALEMTSPDSLFFIEVSDSGLGITPEFMPELFQEFRQGSSGDARSHGGTGLGLPIVKKLVERMAGTVSVKSFPGEGSTFRVILRQCRSASATPPG